MHYIKQVIIYPGHFTASKYLLKILLHMCITSFLVISMDDLINDQNIQLLNGSQSSLAVLLLAYDFSMNVVNLVNNDCSGTGRALALCAACDQYIVEILGADIQLNIYNNILTPDSHSLLKKSMYIGLHCNFRCV